MKEFITDYGTVKVQDIFVDITGKKNLAKAVEIISVEAEFKPIKHLGISIAELDVDLIEAIIERSAQWREDILENEAEEETGLTKKKFKVTYTFEVEVEVLAEEGEHQRILENGCGATLDFQATYVSQERDEEGLYEWDAPYHPENTEYEEIN